jgi:HK97 family phage prohead protease
MDLMYKSLPFAVKAMSEDGAGSFDLYAAMFGNVDAHGEVVMPNAFTNLDEFAKDGWGAVNHANYGPDLGIALIDSATQDAVGLRVQGRFHSTADAQAVRTKIRERMDAGKSVKCSFGYSVLDASEEIRDGKRIALLKSLAIYEFSFVNSPANRRAEVLGVKSSEPRLSEIKAILTDAKAGRTLSASSIAKLRAVHASMAPACDDLKAFLDEHDRTVDRENGKSASAADIETARLLLDHLDASFRFASMETHQ